MFSPAKFHTKTRLRVEHLECRTQPGSILPFSEFSLMGASLFDTDPLSGQQLGTTSDASLLAILADSTSADAPAFAPVTTQRIQVIQTSQPAPVQAPAATQAADLQLIAGTRFAAKSGLDLSAPVAAPTSAPVQAAQIDRVIPMPVVPVTNLQVVEHTVNEEGPTTREGFDLFTTFNGVAGNDIGNAAAADDSYRAYYAGYTERNGNRDIMVWSVDSFATFGSVRRWQTIISSTGTGADEGTGIAVSPDGANVYVSGTMPGTNGSAAVVLRLNGNDGTMIGNPVAVDGPGNDRGTDVRTYFDASFLGVTGEVTTPTDTLIWSATFAPDLTPFVSTGYGFMGITVQRGDAVAVNYAGESYIAGSLQDGGTKGFFFKEFFGTPGFAGVTLSTGVRFGGVDFDPVGTNTFWITGEVQLQPEIRMTIQKYQDNGAQFQGIWGFDWTYGTPGNFFGMAGHYVRGDYDGNTYIINELWGPTENRETGDNDAHIFKVGPLGSTRPDFYHYGLDAAQALRNDKGFGLGFNPNLGQFAFTTGKANSVSPPDIAAFPVSSYAYQTIHGDNNGTISDAFAGMNYLPG